MAAEGHGGKGGGGWGFGPFAVESWSCDTGGSVSGSRGGFKGLANNVLPDRKSHSLQTRQFVKV